ncbi:MAG TPA: glycosyltransferase family 2 protein [Flavobacterium sp.]|nr:glycosyltransferase family 2 protein [Flavobacterium sp.]
MPLVSVVITTHNRYKILEDAIKSVLNQTVKDIECIVVDDASSDLTQEHYERDSRILYLRIEAKNSKGANHARNVGVVKAQGDYIAFLDDDDVWLPQKIEKQLAIFKQHPESVLYCGRRFEKKTSNKTKTFDLIPPRKHSGDISRLICCTYVTSTSCLMIPSKIMKEEMFDEKLPFWQEYELTIRLAQKVPFFFVPEALVVCTDDAQVANRISNRFFEWKKTVLYIRNKHQSLYEKLTLKENWMYHGMLYKDAFRRSLRSGIKKNILFYGFLRFIFEYIPSKILHLF